MTDDNEIIINRTLKGETISYLVKPENFIIPATLSKLTGITNELANKYGYPISDIDTMVSNIFKDKAHCLLPIIQNMTDVLHVSICQNFQKS